MARPELWNAVCNVRGAMDLSTSAVPRGPASAGPPSSPPSAALAASERLLVLVVEDEPDLQSLLAFNLEAAGFAVICASRGAEAFVLAQERRPSVVVLDLNLPDVSGVDVCRSVRADRSLRGTAVMMLTARSSEDDRLSGFTAGTDDYVVKPFHVREVVLRVRALANRVRGMGARNRDPRPGALSAGGIEVRPEEEKVLVDGEEVLLRPQERKLLEALLARPGCVISRLELLESVWKGELASETRALDVTVQRLRSRLGARAEVIETVPRVGYRARC